MRCHRLLVLLVGVLQLSVRAFTIAPSSIRPRTATTIMDHFFPSATRPRRHHKPPAPTSPLFASRQPAPPPPPPPPPPPKRKESASHFAYWFTTQAFLMPEIRPVSVLNVLATAAISWAYRRGMVGPLDLSLHQMLASPLGFFLTFRAQEGFNRCQEARRTWDAVLDTSRDMVRCVVGAESLVGSGGQPIPSRRLLDLTCSYGILLEEFVTQKSRALELEALLDERDFLVLAKATAGTNRPLALTELLAEEVVQLAKTHSEFRASPQFGRMLNYIDELGHHITKVQRLMKPPVPPMFYTHALRFLTIYLFTLPFALLDKIPGNVLVPAMGLVTWALYGLRELGIKAQYPFSTGLVDLKTLWKEVIYDARSCLESVHKEEAAAHVTTSGGKEV